MPLLGDIGFRQGRTGTSHVRFQAASPKFDHGRQDAGRLKGWHWFSVNVSARQFHQSDFVHEVLERTGANLHRLKLALTESRMVSKVEDVVALAGRIGLTVIAEGVIAQRDFLASQGGHACQGSWYSRPLPRDECEALAERTSQAGPFAAYPTLAGSRRGTLRQRVDEQIE